MTLTYSAIVSPPVPITGGETVPDGSPRRWSPITSTLIQGEHDAVLVDPPLTVPQAEAVAAWVAAAGVRLIAIYSTHGHADHWFGTATIQERFPTATAYAMPHAIEVMRRLGSPASRHDRWDRQFPGLIGDTTVRAVTPQDGVILLEDHQLIAVDTGHTDTDGTTVLHVPSIGLVVAGDSIYANLHQSLREGSDGGIERWLAALDTVDALRPRYVVCGHKDPRTDDSPGHIDETRQYLRDAAELVSTGADAHIFFDEMIRRHPSRLNTGALWTSVLALTNTVQELE